MNRKDAVIILERMLLEDGESKLIFSQREAVRSALQDMKTIQIHIDKREEWHKNFDNMTEQDWKESMEASRDDKN